MNIPSRSRWRTGRLIKFFIFGIAALIHIILILTITVNTGQKERRSDNTIFKMVDVQEYIPPPPEPEKREKKVQPEETVKVPPRDSIAEEIIETEKEVEVAEPDTVPSEPVEEPAPVLIEFLPQHKISVPPTMPTDEILARIKYPPLANRQKIEGVVFLELYIDKYGEIRNIIVLKDPGYGLAEAAVAAMKGIRVEPAEANGIPVAVRLRYPIRFKLR